MVAITKNELDIGWEVHGENIGRLSLSQPTIISMPLGLQSNSGVRPTGFPAPMLTVPHHAYMLDSSTARHSAATVS